ncbi:hypothetical protein NFI96_026000 [Prochilodus magdalenae]|nr:hypothetical protein NFI96_026000 [Prochilodus magdalenae]
MISKIFAQILGNVEEKADIALENEGSEDVFEFEDGEWVIINIQENHPLGLVEEDPLENLLIEHPSMSVYQMRSGRIEGEEVSEGGSPRSVPVRRHISWCLAAWGIPLPILLSVQRSRTHGDRRKLTRTALHRQNLANTRFSPTDRRYGHFKQPTQRLYNY